MIPLTGLWEGTDKNQNKFFSGNLGNARVMVFKNTKKEKDNQPDYIVYLDEKKKKEESSQESAQPASSPQQEDDLPF